MAESTMCWIPVQILFFLRFIQLGSTVLTGFIAIYFIYWHDIIKTQVPLGLIIVICTGSIAFLECYLTSAYTLSKHTTNANINYRLLLKTTAPVTVFMAFGYYSLRHVPYIQEWCEGDNWFRPTPKGFQGSDGEVEKHLCALTCTVIVTGAVALVFTVLLSLFAVWGMMTAEKPGHIVLKDDGEYEDDPITGPELSEKDEEFDEV